LSATLSAPGFQEDLFLLAHAPAACKIAVVLIHCCFLGARLVAHMKANQAMWSRKWP
jgi:hypothetical protein